MEHRAEHRPEGTLPEVVPIENLQANTIRHDDSYYRYSRPTQPFSPLANSNQDSRSSYVSAVASSPNHTGNGGSTVGVSGFETTSRRKFAVLVAMASFLFTALALAIGLGIPLALCRKRLDPDGYAPLLPEKVYSLKKGAYCNDRGELTRDNIFTIPNGTATFELSCGVAFREGLPALDPTNDGTTSNGTVRNIQVIVSYSVSDCILACHSLNVMTEEKERNYTSPQCQSVTFIPTLSDALSRGNDGNCYLKNSTVFDLSRAAVRVVAVSAELQRLRK